MGEGSWAYRFGWTLDRVSGERSGERLELEVVGGEAESGFFVNFIFVILSLFFSRFVESIVFELAALVETGIRVDLASVIDVAEGRSIKALRFCISGRVVS